MKINRYLYKEILITSLSITAVLLCLLIATELSDTLTKILTRQYSSNAILYVIGFQIFILLPEIIPAAYFLACLTTLNRFSQDLERVVYHAVGISDKDILKRLLLATSLPIIAVVLALQNYITPLANYELAQYIEQQKSRPITDIIQAKTFNQISSAAGTLYANGADNQSEQLKQVFSASNRQGELSIILADSAKTGISENGQYLLFQQGTQTRFSFTENSESQQGEFSALNILIDQAKAQSAQKRRYSSSSKELIATADRSNQIEVLHRSISSLFIPVFCMWAVALTRFKPRSGKAGAMAIGIFFYILSNFSYRTVQSAFAKSDAALFLSPWWYFALLALVAYYLVARKAQ
ncbi:LptF/LptG family permease [Reinekea thalattae]|uniref:LptF/LptG family permease n=1 Tax=Reinekea thalattae TaxID=2593301 RepID=A0A5C8Z931_9GAMM|nr:LptF/LptG family permease [Reinekea thalattae]TXR53356.1 LptF/LptG family permease [Reinekea thalattae]